MNRPLKYSLTVLAGCVLIGSASCSRETEPEPAARTVIIGDQEWATCNLDVGTFRNGDSIPRARTGGEWIEAWREGKPAWCYYDNDPANGEKYGRIYNRFAVEDPRELAPAGWHIASGDDWKKLLRTVGNQASIKLKSTTGWNEEGNGTDSVGFCALPAGSRYGNGKFYGMGDYAVFGTSDGGNMYLTKFGGLRGGRTGRGFGRNGLYLRCVRRKLYEGFDIIPSGVSNPGIMFVNHEATGRSGHMGSALTECMNGDILAFYGNTSGIIHGGHLAQGWTEYKRSEDGGRTWSDPVVLDYSKGIWDRNLNSGSSTYESSMVMSAMTAPNGNIVVIALVFRGGYVIAAPMYLVSYDNGHSWSGPRPVDPSGTGEEMGLCYDASMVHDGEMYVVFKGGRRGNGPLSLYVSTDNGESFEKRSDHLFASRTFHHTSWYETVAVLDDGSIIVYAYQGNDEHYAPYVISRDRGYTWSDVKYAYFEKKVRNLQMSGKIGDYYFLTCRTGNRGYDSGSLVLYASKDGINWNNGIYLNRGEGVAGPGSDAYSSNEIIGKHDPAVPERLLIQSSISYCSSRVNLKHWWIENVAGLRH